MSVRSVQRPIAAEYTGQNIELFRWVFPQNDFNYCPLVWHFCGATDSNKIEKLQGWCLRIIYKECESSYDRLLETANTTTLVISRLKILILEVFKSIRQLNPKYICDLFEVKTDGYSWRNHVKVLQPKRRTTTYELRTVSFTGAKLLNDLFPLLSDVEEIDVFKSSLAILREDTSSALYLHILYWLFVYSTFTCTCLLGLIYTQDEITYSLFCISFMYIEHIDRCITNIFAPSCRVITYWLEFSGFTCTTLYKALSYHILVPFNVPDLLRHIPVPLRIAHNVIWAFVISKSLWWQVPEL